MSAKHVILCGGAKLSTKTKEWASLVPLRLQLGDDRGDVHLHLHDLTRAMVAVPRDVEIDLLEVASYVFAADQAIGRGGTVEFEYGEKWRRQLWFEIPVRCPEVWNRKPVVDALKDALGFMSDDDYCFNFVKLKEPRPLDAFIDYCDGEDAGERIEEVMLFSGGVDSFGGAVREIAVGSRRVALVSHEPTSKVGAPQRELLRVIQARLKPGTPRPLHVQVEVNKSKSLSRDFAQRTRSFLFGSIAAVTARMLNLSRIRFYENGVVSFNLPLSLQTLGGRASRTTHPRSLDLMATFLSALFGATFAIENPFLWHTKAEIFESIVKAGFGDLCALTISCAKTIERTTQHSHCGVCSQCVDRRITGIAAKLSEREDPLEMYETDTVHHAWETPEECALVERYVGAHRNAEKVRSPHEFVAAHGEVGRALRSTGLPADQAALHALDLHRRHGEQVRNALVSIVASCAERLVKGQIHSNSLAGIAVGLYGKTPNRDSSHSKELSTQRHYAKPTVDESEFKLRYGSRSCFLGNTIEFKLAGRLVHSLGKYVSVDTLREDVWDGQRVQRNTVSKTASTLRRKVKNEIPGITINGAQPNSYQLLAH